MALRWLLKEEATDNLVWDSVPARTGYRSLQITFGTDEVAWGVLSGPKTLGPQLAIDDVTKEVQWD